jgi:dihydrofolate synthase/folylpolyglutamate synthase
MNFDEAVQYLLSLGHETLAIKLGLTNTERLLDALASPQKSFRAVQIAGTNGKGSTAVVLDAICRAAAIHTGLYTSPHLVHITERIRINGQQLKDEEFARLTAHVRDAALRLQSAGKLETMPTFFEHVTAIALQAFSEARVQLAILETGLGGRLDATTVARAQTVAITPVALDHQEYLGDTIAAIASEKAAIIRPGVTAIIGPQPAEALTVIRQYCEANNVTPRLDDCRTTVLGAGRDGRLRVTFETAQDSYRDVLLGLRGRHQVANVSLAIRLAEALREQGFDIPREAIIEGVTNAKHAGRLELREGHPSILFDGAHNAAGARALRDYLDEFVSVPVTLVFGAMRDKDLAEMAASLFPAAHHLVLSGITNMRAATTEMLMRAALPVFDSSRITCAASIDEALRAAQERTPPDALICVTGSLYLVGEAQKFLDREEARWLANGSRKA